jgi:hypothetical protein
MRFAMFTIGAAARALTHLCRDARGAILALLAGLAAAGGYWIARAAPPPEPLVLGRTIPPAVPRSPRTGPPPPTSAELAASGDTAPTCSGSSPGPAWICQNGVWQVGVPGTTSGVGAGGGSAASGCRSGQPGPSFTCQGGSWVLAAGSDRTGDETAPERSAATAPAGPTAHLPSSADRSVDAPTAVSQPPAVPLIEVDAMPVEPVAAPAAPADRSLFESP